MIYIITNIIEWEKAKEKGFFETASLQIEGFIHACSFEQVAIIYNKFYKDNKGVIQLHINEKKIKAPLKLELSPSLKEYFPHIYGVLNIDAVETITVLS